MHDFITRARLDVAIAHLAPGAEVELNCRGGVTHRATGSPGDPLSICALRSALASPPCQASRFDESSVHSLLLGGTITGSVGDLYSRASGRLEERWFATLLHPTDVVPVLNLVGESVPEGSDVEARVAFDNVLRVSVVRISATTDTSITTFRNAAADAYSACLVEELLALAGAHHFRNH